MNFNSIPTSIPITSEQLHFHYSLHYFSNYILLHYSTNLHFFQNHNLPNLLNYLHKFTLHYFSSNLLNYLHNSTHPSLHSLYILIYIYLLKKKYYLKIKIKELHFIFYKTFKTKVIIYTLFFIPFVLELLVIH